MSEPKKTKKPAPKGAEPETHDPEETVKLSPEEIAKLRSADSEAIERAVYDGMQDLRVKKPGTPKK